MMMMMMTVGLVCRVRVKVSGLGVKYDDSWVGV